LRRRPLGVADEPLRLARRAAVGVDEPLGLALAAPLNRRAGVGEITVLPLPAGLWLRREAGVGEVMVLPLPPAALVRREAAGLSGDGWRCDRVRVGAPTLLTLLIWFPELMLLPLSVCRPQ
jgi:hypothetical protein